MPPDEMARWQGGVDNELKGLREEVAQLWVDKRSSEKVIVALQVQLASIKTQIGIWSAAGSLVGAVIVYLIISAIGGHR
jgi:hypothetical protein